MDNIKITEDIKKNICFTLAQLANHKTVSKEVAQEKKTLLDSTQRLIDLFIRNVGREGYQPTPLESAHFYFNDKDTNFIEYMVEELEKEIFISSNAMDSLHQNNDHRTYRDVVICYEKLTTIRRKLNEELLYSEKSKKRLETRNKTLKQFTQN